MTIKHPAVGPQDKAALHRAILMLETREEAAKFLRDLLTEEEINEISARWKAARMLAHKIPYTQIEKATGLSSATVARVKKWLVSGTGGYREVLKKLKGK